MKIKVSVKIMRKKKMICFDDFIDDFDVLDC